MSFLSFPIGDSETEPAGECIVVSSSSSSSPLAHLPSSCTVRDALTFALDIAWRTQPPKKALLRTLSEHCGTGTRVNVGHPRCFPPDFCVPSLLSCSSDYENVLKFSSLLLSLIVLISSSSRRSRHAAFLVVARGRRRVRCAHSHRALFAARAAAPLPVVSTADRCAAHGAPAAPGSSWCWHNFCIMHC